jgi:glutamate decarboxylase
MYLFLSSCLLGLFLIDSQLLQTVGPLIHAFIKAADDDAPHKYLGSGGTLLGSTSDGTALLDRHPPQTLQDLLDLKLADKGSGKDGLVSVTKQILNYSVNTWNQGFMDKLYSCTNPVC